ncbi:MAB_1171c family putative transporter [Streptomyces fragilis]|uniref:MAB_1171c family putative transporter n=1 Tax=Streptomyces fragilis TaxID=67301 RepID=A0ABV2YK01_9ACTN|nr:MAB_1171c family putative transporter [Streptomyces fragilis]
MTAIILVASLLYKLPTVIRAGRNPLLRQVGGLLAAACGVFIFAQPATIAVVNETVGITNVSAPWVYSLLTGFCAVCLLLIIRWRGGTPRTVRRAGYWVYAGYGAVLVALWVLFALGDADVERLQDFDTYYATTPFIREMIVLYLTGHMVAVVITSGLLWTWENRVRGTGWLHPGVVLLGVGYAANLAYDFAKLTPVVAHWFGNSRLDWMNTQLAPLIAALVGVLIALGFILPHLGAHISHRLTVRRDHRALGPLAKALGPVPTASAPVALGRWSPIDLRLTRRQTVIRDALRHLAPFLDAGLRERTRAACLAAGSTPAEADAQGDAAAIVAAVATMQTSTPGQPRTGRTAYDGLHDLTAISRALRRPVGIPPVPEKSTP